jgi:glucan phosphoethanolaminetransferase (alkaline phosphatase superfamily)
LAALLYSLPTLLIAAWAMKGQSARIVLMVVVSTALIATLVAVVARTWRRFFVWQWPLFALEIGFVGYTLSFGMPPAHTLSMIVVNTSMEEIIGLIRVAQGALPVGVWVAATGLYWWLARQVADEPIFALRARRLRPYLLAAMLLATAFLGVNSADLIDGIALNPAAGSLIFIGGWLPRAHSEMHGASVHKIPYRAHREGGEEVHILIIGESERRASWSAYGYHRMTTPFMDKLKHEAVFLENATADANLTSWAVPIILTGMPPEEFSLDKIRGNLVDLANEAGYSTAWVDNQDIQTATSVGMSATHTTNPIDLHADSMGRHTLDEVLLPAIQRELNRSGAPRFIVIHMMGAHWEYYRRYPKSFQRFGTGQGLSLLSIFFADAKGLSNVVDAYDNAVLYNDWFLHQVIESARGLSVPATVMFVSDHGEDLQLRDGTAGHGAPAYTDHAFDIPAFVWVNSDYRAEYPARVQALESNAAKVFRSHNVFETERELMGINWPGERAERSLVSARYVPSTEARYVAGGKQINKPTATTLSPVPRADSPQRSKSAM